MQLARLIRKDISALYKVFFTGLFFIIAQSLFAQENSPYSRYGLGDMVPNTNILNRSMGGVTAGYSDPLSINFNNPASYAAFKTYVEEKSKRPLSGRVLFDVGLNLDNHTLQTPNQTDKFTTSNLLFSYLQLGVPLSKNWGLSFGLRPVSRIDYKIIRRELLRNPTTGNIIDSAETLFTGDGGSYLPNIGTGFSIGKLSLGVTMGYLFGKKQYITTRSFLNDSITYHSSVDTSRTSFGSIVFNAGLQYKINFSKKTSLNLGAFGNLQHTLHGRQDDIRNTISSDATNGSVKLDSVYQVSNVKGDIIYPASYTMGFMLDHLSPDLSGWSFGVDYVQNKWSNYRFYGAKDSVQDNWQLRVGAQLRPKPNRNYFSNVAYRAGFFTGPDYINVGGNLPQLGVSFGAGLPIANFNRLSPGQYTILNLAIEYSKRGNNTNILKENTFRISAGFSFSDLWFSKRKYD